MLRKAFKYKIVIYLLLVANSTTYIQAQEKGLILTKYYSPRDYNSGNQNWTVTQDERGILYFGNAAGVLEYDGVSWRTIPVTNNSAVRCLTFDSNNILYAGAYNELGYLTPSKTGNLTYKSLIHLIDSSHKDFGDIWDIYNFTDTIFFLSDKYLFRYQNEKFDYWDCNSERYYLSHKINNSYFVQEMDKGLLKFENESLNLIEKGEFFKDKRIHSILPYDDKLLICTRTQGLYLYDNKNSKVEIRSFSNISSKTKDLNSFLIENVFYHGIEISDSTYAFSTINGEILIVDTKWNILDVINYESIGIRSSIHYLFHQKDHSLWLALGNGICQVEILSPFRYWNDNMGISGTITDIAKSRDNLYVSTTSGVYCTNSKSISKFDLNTFKKVEGNFEQSWEFLYYQPPGAKYKVNPFKDSTDLNKITTDKTLLLVSSSKGLYQIIDGKSKLVSDYRSTYMSYQYKKDPSILFIGLNNGVAMLEYKNKNWIDHGLQYEITDQIRDISEDSLGNLWLSASYKGVYRIEQPLDLKTYTKTFLDTSNNLPSVKAIKISNYKDTLYVQSNFDWHTFNADSLDFNLHVFREDTIQTEENSDLDTLSFHRVSEELLNYTTFFIDLNDETEWISTTMGTCRYNLTAKRNLLDISPTIIRKVIANDSLIYNGSNILHKDSLFTLNANATVNIGTVLEHKNNSLIFYYASPYFEAEKENKYSYYLEGFDNKWSEWTSETKKEYTNLREKDYVFKVKSLNIYEIETPVAEYKFKILAPWYRRLSAYIGYIIIGIIIIVLIVKLYTKRLIREKDKLEKIVIERTQEILMQKEEILVQAEHLKDANEGITARNEELEKQKWEITNQAIKLKKANVELIKLSKVASETDNGIGIFDKDGNIEWINEGFTRMYGYTLDQYKTEKNNNIINSSDNPNITEAIKSCINDKKSVVYKFKTKTRSGNEIWAQTTLTHVVDREGETLNLIAIDSDITDLKLAEKEIEDQRDKLALSNATKNKFFRIIAHDLRNPISTLAGSTNLILNDFEEYNQDQTKRFIGELNKLSQTTFNLLENLLDWSSTQMGDIRFTPENIDLKLITNENIELINRKIDQKNINLIQNITKDSFAFADENMVKTIIRNLLSNAVKFTPENGQIEITTQILKNNIHYSVKDNGIGIEKENLKKLFRIDQHYTAIGLNNEKGSGLGLILCKEFVEKNGGNIEINSTPNEGTTIEFTLKLASS
ncbi:MAG: PAS domain S-box protein [Bacteroidales bacterium]|nr:PAS domain S-box protein [Bacteroidales bacterium]